MIDRITIYKHFVTIFITYVQFLGINIIYILISQTSFIPRFPKLCGIHIHKIIQVIYMFLIWLV